MKKWKIRGSEKFKLLLHKFRSDNKISTVLSGNAPDLFYGVVNDCLCTWELNDNGHFSYEEITVEKLEQLYYLNNINIVNADYVKYVGVQQNNYRIPNTIYKVHERIEGFIDTVICNVRVDDIFPGTRMFISNENNWVAATETEYLAQAETTKTNLKEWSAGTYVVCIKDYTNSFKIGAIAELTTGAYSLNEDCVNLKNWKEACYPPKTFCKWFATKQEAEDFAKTTVVEMEDFKIGDWVYAEKNQNEDHRDSEHIPVFQIKEIKHNYLRPVGNKVTGVHVRHCRKALLHEIPNIEVSKQTKEELLEEAYRRYPVGTKVKSLFHKDNPILTITKNNFDHCKKDGIHVSAEGYLAAVVYENGQWAEIVTETIEDIQAECKRRFPIGCKFKSPSTGEIYTLNQTNTTYELIGKNAIDAGKNQSYLYYNGKYAELFSEPEHVEPVKSEYLIAAEKALKHFEDAGFYVGCEYENTSGKICKSKCELTIVYENCKDCFIECGEGFLWEYERDGQTDVYGKLILNNKPQSMEREFQIGDIVECVNECDHISVGMQGVIVNIEHDILGVSWYNFTKGHSCSSNCTYGTGYYLNKNKIRLINTLSSNIPTSQEFDTYGLKVGDTLDVNVLNAWTVIEGNRSTDDKTEWHRGGGMFIGNRVIKSFHLIHGHVGFEVSGTNIIYLKAEGFKEFADSYYKRKLVSYAQSQYPLDAYDILMHQREQLIQKESNQTKELLTLPTNKIYVRKSKSIK